MVEFTVPRAVAIGPEMVKKLASMIDYIVLASMCEIVYLAGRGLLAFNFLENIHKKIIW